MRTLCAAPLALALAGCATITAPEETKALNEASAPFIAALKSLEAQRTAALAASNRAHAFQSVLFGRPLVYRTDCEKLAERADQQFQQALGAKKYNATAADAAYLIYRDITPCEIVGVAVASASPGQAIAGPTGDPDLTIPLGQTSLAAVGSELESYVKAISDLATGETYGTLAEQRKNAFEAAGGFATALGVPFATQVAAVLHNLADSAEASRRNAATLKILNEIDPILPAYMERVGLAGRVVVASAIFERARAATSLAAITNASLASPEAMSNRGLRAQLLASYDERIRLENDVLTELRITDPMRSARAFAAAHHSLQVVFADPKSHRSALARGLKDLHGAAAELKKALDEAQKEKA